MAREVGAEVTERIACDLVDMLHQGASADEFAARLAQAEELPDDDARKAGLMELVRMAMAVRNRLDLWQQRESGMLAVIESARDLSSRLDLNELLRAVVSRARNMLGSQVAWLSAYDEDMGAFHVLAADGVLSRSTGDMVADHHFGVVSVIVATRLPFTTPDYLHDKRFPHDAKLDAAFRDEGIAAVAGVPLLWEDEVIGLLFVADRYHRTHTAQHISILSTLATHAAVAIKNAMAFERASAALKSAQLARAELERHARNVQAAAEAHEQLTTLLAKGASLATLCESVARLLGGSVLVLDEAAHVIARGTDPGYRASGAESYAPHGENSSVLASAVRRSRQIGRSVAAYERDGEFCRVNAVIGGDDVLGSVLLFCRRELDEISVRTFERSTSIVGIVLLSRERTEATKSRDLATLLRSLVSPRQDDVAILCERADRFGVDLRQPCSLLLVEMGDSHASHAARQLRARNTLAHAIYDEIDGMLAALCATTKAEDTRRAIVELVKGHFGTDYRGIVSRPLSGPAEIPGAYVTLRRALPVLRRIGIQGHVVGQNEMALYSTLFETHYQASLAAFLDATIGALIAYDQKRGSELTPTLLVYFDSNQNAKVAAQRLGIHVNTVRQRLATIEDLLGHWGNATRALEIHIAVRLWSLGSESQGPAPRAPN
jgi:GAF domain-containing protein